MFAYLKRSYVIEKAYAIWRQEVGIDLKVEISKMPMNGRTDYRNNLRESQKHMGANEKEVAVLAMVPFLKFLDPNAKGLVNNLVDSWTHRGAVRSSVSQLFKQAMYAG